MSAGFARKLDVLSKRYRFVRWLHGTETGLLLAVTMAVSLFFVDRILYELNVTEDYLSTPGLVAGILVGLTVLVTVGAMVVAAARPVNLPVLAAEVDRRAGCNEALATACEVHLKGTRTPFREALLGRAEAFIEALNLSRVLPGPSGKPLLIVVFALLAAGALVAMPPRRYYKPTADFTAAATRGVAPFTVSFKNASSGHIDGYRWDFGDGEHSQEADPQHTYDTPGVYSVCLTTFGPRGQDSRRREGYIVVLPARSPLSKFAARPLKGRAPLNVTFVNQSENAEQFLWDLGDGHTRTDKEFSYVYVRPGTYTVTLEARTGKNADRSSQTIRVLAPDAPVADFAGHPLKGKAPLEVQFEDRSLGEAAEWQWDFGDPYAGDENSSVEKNPIHVYRVPGFYTVKLRVRGPKGEDEEIKERYIHVEQEGGGGGGRQGGSSSRSSGGPRGGNQAGQKPGEIYGPKTRPPKVKFEDEMVKPAHDPHAPFVQKEKNFAGPDDGRSGSIDPDKRFSDVFPRYQRQAEETMTRERIPSDLRALVKRYFECIRPEK